MRRRWRPPSPTSILTQELCRVCAVSYREVNEVARADRCRHHGRLARADVDRGHPQHDHDGRRDGRGRGRRDRRRRGPARAARGGRAAGRGAARGRPSGAARRRARVARSAVRGRPLGPGADPPGRWLGPARRGRREGARRRRGTPSPRSTPRCCSSCRAASTSPETVQEWARTPSPPWLADLPAVQRGAVFALDGSAYFSRPGPRVIDGIELLAEIMDPDGFVDIAPPGGWTPVPASRPRLCRSARRSPACGAGPPTPSAAPDDLEGWAQLCPDCVGKAGDNSFLRFRLRQALTERSRRRGRGVGPPTAARRPRRGRAGEPRDRLPDRRRADDRRRTPATDRSMIDYYEARAPEYDDWYLRRGRYARGADPRCRLERRARRRRSLARRAAARRARSSSWRPAPAGGRRCWRRKGELSLYDASPAALDRARERLVAHDLRAHLHVRDAWAEPDRAVDGRVHRASG